MRTSRFFSAAIAAVLAFSTLTGCNNNSESGGFDNSKAIGTITREEGSGTRGAFIELFGIEQKNEAGEKIDYTTDKAVVTNSTSVMMTTVAGDLYSIGYISLGSLNDTVKALRIDGAAASADNIKNGSYKISRPFNIVTKDGLDGTSQDFIDFIMSADGQSVIEQNGYISASDNGAYSGSAKAFGDNCQIVIATHVDKEHIHTHFIINTYGIDGQKFNDNLATRKNLREISDRVCLAFGIKPIEPKHGASGIDHSEWEHKHRGTSWKEKIRSEIDRLILKVKNVDELLAELEMLDYTVKRGKYISIKAPDQQRAVRLKTLGEDYTVEQLASRILWRDVGAGLNNPCERSALHDKYSETIVSVQAVNASHPSLEQLGTLLTVINRDRLQSIGEVDGKIEQIKFELEKSRQEVNIMETKCKLLRSLAAQAEEYFSLMDKPSLTTEEQLRAKMYMETLAQKNIESASDYEYLKGVIADVEKKSAPVKAHYNKCAALFKEYSDISETYNEISQGDYISKLIEQQRKKDEPQARPRR